jgi:flavin reductase (DIM6/NTAB) family NADH-FMN oxidoreductase RutF
MDKQKVIPLSRAYSLLNPGVVVLVSVGDGLRDNLFAVTWNMPVESDPPMVAILSGKDHYSYPFIERTGEFGINILDASWVNSVYLSGTTSGHDMEDKFTHVGLHRCKAERIKAPLVEEAVASLECRVVRTMDFPESVLLVAEVVEAYACANHFAHGKWTFENDLKLLHHVSGPRFCVSERAIVVEDKEGA